NIAPASAPTSASPAGRSPAHRTSNTQAQVVAARTSAPAAPHRPRASGGGSLRASREHADALLEVVEPHRTPRRLAAHDPHVPRGRWPQSGGHHDPAGVIG